MGTLLSVHSYWGLGALRASSLLTAPWLSPSHPYCLRHTVQFIILTTNSFPSNCTYSDISKLHCPNISNSVRINQSLSGWIWTLFSEQLKFCPDKLSNSVWHLQLFLVLFCRQSRNVTDFLSLQFYTDQIGTIDNFSLKNHEVPCMGKVACFCSWCHSNRIVGVRPRTWRGGGECLRGKAGDTSLGEAPHPHPSFSCPSSFLHLP